MAAVEERSERVDPSIAVGIMLGALDGLHAAHEAKNDRGVPLDIVHRDVSPQNILVGVDGVTRVVDFGVAKAVGRLQTTDDGRPKGKAAYMAPEQIRGEAVDRRADVWAASVVLWEMLSGQRLFTGDSAAAVMHAVLRGGAETPSAHGAPPELDAIVMRGLSATPAERFETAREMALALEEARTPASTRVIGEWVEAKAQDTLRSRAARVEEMESAGGGRPSSDGSLRRQLVGLGFDNLKKAEPTGPTDRPRVASSEEPTGAAPGRIRASDAPPSAPLPAAPRSSEDAPRVPSRSRRRTIRIVAAGAALVAGAAAVIVTSHRSTAPAREAAPTATFASSAPPASSERSTSPAPVASSLGETREAEADASARSALAAPPSLRPGPQPRLRPPDAGARRPDCDPPYTVGPPPDFIRRPKLECVSP
jgi:serine/threonine-protein kinase